MLLPERLLGLFGGLTTIRSKVFGLLVIPAAIEAVEGDSGYSVLIEGHRSKEGKFKVVSADEEGVIGRATRWLKVIRCSTRIMKIFLLWISMAIIKSVFDLSI